MSVYFIGCLHLGHDWAAKARGFDDVARHDEAVMDGIRSVISKRDKLFILGDISMEKCAPYPLLDTIPGIVHVILGNHDRHQDVLSLLDHVDYVSGVVKYKDAWLTHIPVHPMELESRMSLNIHAHIHSDVVTNPSGRADPRYINVDAAQLDYEPIQWESIRRVI